MKRVYIVPEEIFLNVQTLLKTSCSTKYTNGDIQTVCNQLDAIAPTEVNDEHLDQAGQS